MATTSSKPPSVIKADIRRVLDRMQVQYREIKGGFECVHAPSIDLSSVQSNQLNNTRRSHQFGHTNSIHDGASMRRSLTKKASKLSFALKGKEKEKGKGRQKKKNGKTGLCLIFLVSGPSSKSTQKSVPEQSQTSS